MPAALYSKEEILQRLLKLFRANGYSGTSLSEISTATGLGRASLYHHFPHGKEEMVQAVLDYAVNELKNNVFNVVDKNLSPEEKLSHVLKGLEKYFSKGKENCMMGVLALSKQRSNFKQTLQISFKAWIQSIAKLLEDTGMPKQIAWERAEDSVIKIQGAVVVARALDDLTPFHRILEQTPNDLLKPI